MRQSIQVIRGGTSSATRRISSSTFKKKRGVKFTLRFSRKAPILPRFSKLCEARSRLHRRRCLQVNTRWKALAEIYTMHSVLQLSNLNLFVSICRNSIRFPAHAFEREQKFTESSKTE